MDKENQDLALEPFEPQAKYTQNPLNLQFQEAKKGGPVECLGRTFPNEEARRTYFLERLREKLEDPEFRKIEGFPFGEDEDILALSDPPYYTACPNPWIGEFIAQWENQKPPKPEGYKYQREPYAADVSEGKNDPIYNAHSYHTKVPHKAIMRYILHYTEPGDIVFDGFCGTGMTGVAAQMCGDRDTVVSLGYQVKEDGTILREETADDGKKVWVPFSKLGARRAVLNDLSPAATFIAYNYNTPVDVQEFEREAKRILAEVEAECGWMYETVHSDGKTKGRINYTVWSDVFVCPNCFREFIFWDVAVDKKAGEIKDEYFCPHCQSKLTKRNVEHVWVTKFDSEINDTVKLTKQVPVLINYSIGTTRFEKVPDAFDIETIKKADTFNINYWFPTLKIPRGAKTGEPIRVGISHVHLFYTSTSLAWLATLRAKCKKLGYQFLIPFSMINTISKLYRYNVKKPNYKGQGGGILTGTLYVPSLIRGLSATSSYKRGMGRLSKIYEANCSFKKQSLISSSSATNIGIHQPVIDYIFLDPPFGSNLNYSELSFLWESWLKVWTNSKPEAIENKTQGKGANEYRRLMTECFKEAYRLLKSGRWMTVEFSNTQASVWNNIQTALTEAGFVVANVSALDKKQGSFNAVTNTTSVKQDLVISAYKPNDGFEDRFPTEANTEAGVWDFVRTHLKYLPVVKIHIGNLVAVPERDPRLLYDQMIAYYVRKGYPVPLSSQEFQLGLRQRFSERDGMFFLPEQAVEYDKKRIQTQTILQNAIFVCDEATAIQWLRQLLQDKPQTTQDIHPQFIQETQRAWSKFEVSLELLTLLEQNFISYDGHGEVSSQIHSYLSTNFKELRNLAKDDPALRAKAKDRWYVPDPNKAADLEKLREKALLREFGEYRESKQRRLKQFRLEAVRVGFKKAWTEKDYATIIEVGQKIPENVLQEDSKLLMYYDNAQVRKG
jgi:DNA modification methylase